MAKQAQVKAKLTLDNVQFVRSIKESIKYAKDLAKQFKAQPIKTTFLAGALAARKGIQATASVVEGLARVAVTAFKVASVAATAFAVGIAGIGVKAVEAAAQMETIETSFKVFLGSAQAAKDRMKELSDFAAHTPFQLPQVAEASKILQVLTKGALATGKGLELVGDIASGTNREFAETAQTVGKLFAALRSGTHPGQALESLQESGAISPEARRKIEGMAGIDGAKAWKLAQAELSRFSGMMQQQSQTWEGLMSTFHDSIRMALAAFGDPLIKDLKPTLDEITKSIFAMTPKIAEAGKAFADGVKVGVGAIEEAFFNPSALIDPFKLGLKAAFLEGVNVLTNGIRLALSIISSGEVWGSLAETFEGLGQILQGELIKAFNYSVAVFRAGIEMVMDRLPESMGGKKSRATLDKERDELTQALALSKGSPMTQRDIHDKLKENLRQSAAVNNSETFASKVEKYRNGEMSGVIGDSAAGKIESGKSHLKKASSSFFDTMTKVVSEFKPDDVVEAGKAMDAFLDSIQGVAKKGQQHSQNTVNELGKEDDRKAMQAENQRRWEAGRAKFKLGARGLPNTSLGSNGGLSYNSQYSGGGANAFTSGFFSGAQRPGDSGFVGPVAPRGPIGQGSMLAGGAQRTVQSLLPLQERRKAAQAVRAAAMGESYLRTGRWETGGQLGKVGAGDRKAAAEYVKDKQREKLGLDKTNEILHTLETKFDTMIGIWQGNQ